MEVRCIGCNSIIDFDPEDGMAQCLERTCVYFELWIRASEWKKWQARASSDNLAFGQFRASLAEQRKEYDALMAMVLKLTNNSGAGYYHPAFTAALEEMQIYVAAHDWETAVCDEVDRTVIAARTAVSKKDRIMAVRVLAHLFPGGVSGSMGLGEARMFIEAHYNDDGSRK